MELDRAGGTETREKRQRVRVGQSQGVRKPWLLRPSSFPPELTEPQFCEEQSGSPMNWEAPHIFSRETKRMCLAGLWQGVTWHQDSERVACCKAAVTDYGRALSPPWPVFGLWCEEGP